MNDIRMALEVLKDRTMQLEFPIVEFDEGERIYRKKAWPLSCDDKILINVYEGACFDEPFCRRDYFFLHFAYDHGFTAVSDQEDNLITVCENGCYIGQPFNGYALKFGENKATAVIGVAIQKDTFIKEFLPAISKDFSLFHFFLDPEKDPYLEGYIHLQFERDSLARTILEAMVMEYANQQKDTQSILKPMVLTLLALISRQYKAGAKEAPQNPLTYRIIEYINTNFGAVTLKEVAEHFSYHPNYISTLIHRDTGHSFSEHLLESRMRIAKGLLQDTRLSIEEIASMLGYKNSSSFYRAFRSYYGISPREYEKSKNPQEY